MAPCSIISIFALHFNNLKQSDVSFKTLITGFQITDSDLNFQSHAISDDFDYLEKIWRIAALHMIRSIENQALLCWFLFFCCPDFISLWRKYFQHNLYNQYNWTICKIDGELNPSYEWADLEPGSKTSSVSSKAELTKGCRSKLEPNYGYFNRPDSLNAP